MNDRRATVLERASGENEAMSKNLSRDAQRVLQREMRENPSRQATRAYFAAKLDAERIAQRKPSAKEVPKAPDAQAAMTQLGWHKPGTAAYASARNTAFRLRHQETLRREAQERKQGRPDPTTGR